MLYLNCKSQIKKLVTLAVCISLTGCVPSEEVEVAMVALIANAKQYQHREVKTFGYLTMSDELRLFINREDALSGNYYHSVSIQQLSERDMQQIDACVNQYVSVAGTVDMKNNQLVFSQAVRFEGGDNNIYSKLVCNHNFNIRGQ